MKSVSISIFVFIGLLNHSPTNAQSPCPDIFEYNNDNNGVYGVITLKPNGQKSTLTVRTNFTITAQLAGDYVGNIQPYGGAEAIRKYNKGQTIQYRVNLPVSSPLPKITAIYVDDDLVCYDNPDTIETNNYVTSITLQHTLYAYAGSNIVHKTRPKYPTQVPVVYNTPPEQTTYTTYYNRPATDVTNQMYPSIPFDFDNIRKPKPRPQPIKPATESDDSDSEFNSNIQCGKAKKEVALLWYAHSYARGEWPWLVAIYQTAARALNFVCSGTLVSDRHVITAAHCMHNKQAADIVVKVGVFNLEEWGGDVVMRRLEKAVVHENFNRTTLANDISLFTMEQSVQFNSNVKPICLWGRNSDLNRIVGQTGVVAGWGDSETGKGGHGDPRMLRLPIVSTEDCRATKADFHKLTSDTTLCAGNRDGSGPCSGDSGGGLYVLNDARWKLRGIVSLALSATSGDKRCNLDEFVVFTDVAKYSTWINRYMVF